MLIINVQNKKDSLIQICEVFGHLACSNLLPSVSFIQLYLACYAKGLEVSSRCPQNMRTWRHVVKLHV